MIYVCNGFSSSMSVDPRIKRVDEPLTKQQVIDLLEKCEWESAIGHKSLADCLSKITGHDIKMNRCGLKLTYDDMILLVSLNGRLPEHPTYVEYEGRLKYSLVRFEKQTVADIQKSQNIINGLKEGGL